MFELFGYWQHQAMGLTLEDGRRRKRREEEKEAEEEEENSTPPGCRY